MRNQLGRRNLSPVDFKLALGRRYNRTKKAVTNPGGIGGKSGKIDDTQNGNQQKQSTAEKLASQHGVSKNTVIRAGKLAEAVEAHPEINPDAVVSMARGWAWQGISYNYPKLERTSLSRITYATIPQNSFSFAHNRHLRPLYQYHHANIYQKPTSRCLRHFPAAHRTTRKRGNFDPPRRYDFRFSRSRNGIHSICTASEK